MSPEVVYTPGSWVAVGAESGWLLVDIDPTDPIVLNCWSLLRGGAQLDEIVDAVLQRGLRAVSSFALVVVSGERRAVVVRGTADATVTAGGTDQQVSAEGVSTWREFPLPVKTSAVSLHAGSAPGQTPAAPEAPLSPGVTLAESIRLTVGDAPLAASPPPRPARKQPKRPAKAAAAGAAEPPPPKPPVPEPADAVPPPSSPAAPPQQAAGAPPPPPEPAAAPPAAEPAGAIPWLPPPGAGPQAGEAPQAPPEPVPVPPAPPEEQPPAEPDSMAWLSAVKPLEPPTDDGPALPGIVSGGRGIGREGPPAEEPAAGQGWTPPGSREPESPDSTVSRASLDEMMGQAGGNMVQAIKCQHGHLSPPMAVSCRVCGFPLMGQAPVTVPRPTLGVLRLSTGDVVALDRTVIMGRNPKLDESAEAERPHVVRLPSPGHDISRTHIEIRLDGWHVLITDLNSVNGTIVTPPWQEPQRLRPNESVPIEPGTVVSLADEVTFRYEVTG